MSLQFVIGSNHADKSNFIYKHILKEASVHRELQYLIVAPEQANLQTQKELVQLSEGKAILNVDVLSFHRLAYRVFQEVGGNTLPILEDLGKSLVVQKVINETADELTVLSGALRRTGTVAQMKSLVSEFLQYRISPNDLKEKQKELPGGLLSSKLSDIEVIYRGFHAYLEQRYLTSEELPQVLCDVMDDSAKLKDSVVVLNGFTGFTPVQLPVVEHLLALCRKVYVVVTMDPSEDLFRRRGPHHLFSMSREMIYAVTKAAEHAGAEADAPLFAEDGPESPYREELDFLERHLFRYDSEVMEGEIEGIRLLEEESPVAECRRAAQEIRRLVREEGYRYREIAVISGDLPTYGREGQRIFEEAGIPCFVDQKCSVQGLPFAEFLRASYDLVADRFSYGSVFRYLRSGFSDLKPEEIDRMENYVLACGTRGRKQYEERWIRVADTIPAESMEELNRIREAFCQETATLAAGLSVRMGTVEQKTGVLYDFLVEQRAEEKCLAQKAHFEEQGETSLAMACGQVYRQTMLLFDKLVEILGPEPIRLKDYQALLETGLSEEKIGLLPPGNDQVLLGDMERTRLDRIRVLFLLGANEGIIPKQVSGGGILSESDREKLKKADWKLAPTPREEIYRQRFYLYLNLTKPTDRLIISWSRVDSDGSAKTPSYLTQTIKKLFPGLKVENLSKEAHRLQSLETEAGREGLLIEGIRKQVSPGQEVPDPEGEELFAALYHSFLATKDGRKLLETLWRAACRERTEGVIGEAAAEALFGRNLVSSVSRVEQFASCAYAHFIRYGLGLTEREIYEFGGADWGNLLHDALKYFGSTVRQRGWSWASLTKEQQETLAEEAVAELSRDRKNTILHSSRRSEYLLKRVRDLLHTTLWTLQEQLKRGSFVPEEFEKDFGPDRGLTHLTLPLKDGRSLSLRGRIDRLDLCKTDNTCYLKVIDYKSGSTALDLNQCYHGLQVQLPVYLSAALDLTEQRYPTLAAEPAGVYYYHLTSDLVETETVAQVPDEEALLNLGRLDGISRGEREILILQDEAYVDGDVSFVIPVKLKKDGTPSAGTHAATREEFEILLEFTRNKIRRLGERMLQGDISVSPVKMGNDRDSCTYCGCRGICGYDSRIPGYTHRMLPAMRYQEVFRKIREEMTGGEDRAVDSGTAEGH